MHLTLMRRGAKQEAELTSREDVTKEAIVSPVNASGSKGNARLNWFSVRPLYYLNIFLILRVLKEWYLVFTLRYEPNKKEI